MFHLTRHLKKIITEDVGWYGMLAILVAYGLNTFHVLSTSNIWYQLLNLTGSIALAYISYVKKSWQTFALNIIWGVLATTSLFSLLFY